MTDAEINLAIAKIEYWDNEDQPVCVAHHGGYVYFPYRPSWGLFNYCCKWSDIGQIIERESLNITIDKTNKRWIAWTWDSIEAYADTPTKAAALCYLKMKGVEL